MTFTEARTLKPGDRIFRSETRETEVGTIADIVKGVWRVNWTNRDGGFLRRESIPMGCVSKLEILR